MTRGQASCIPSHPSRFARRLSLSTPGRLGAQSGLSTLSMPALSYSHMISSCFLRLLKLGRRVSGMSVICIMVPVFKSSSYIYMTSLASFDLYNRSLNRSFLRLLPRYYDDSANTAPGGAQSSPPRVLRLRDLNSGSTEYLMPFRVLDKIDCFHAGGYCMSRKRPSWRVSVLISIGTISSASDHRRRSSIGTSKLLCAALRCKAPRIECSVALLVARELGSRLAWLNPVGSGQYLRAVGKSVTPAL